MPAQTIICLTVFVITLILYMSNKFPLPLVSMTAMGVYVITGCLAPADALSCFSNSSVIIMGSMFIVAGAPACMEELKAAGIENFIHVRCNVLETLKEYNEKLGIK